MRTNSVVIEKQTNINFQAHVQAKKYYATHIETGKFLHMSGEIMTDVFDHAWKGSQRQFENLSVKMGFHQREFHLERVGQKENALHN